MKSVRHKLQTARQLSWPDWLNLLEAWWGLLAFYLAIRLARFEQLDVSMHPARQGRDLPKDATNRAWHTQKLVSMAARLHLLSMTCLPRALTLRWMLSRRGIPAQLQIGMSKSPAGVYAHAWVEVGEAAIGEPEDIGDRFKVLQHSI